MADSGLVGAWRATDEPERIEFGSNTFHSSSRSIIVDGRRMWCVDDDVGDGRAALRSPIFDASGILIASISGNRLFGPQATRFRIIASAGRWEVWDCQLGSHLFVATLDPEGTLQIERADFFGVNGSHVVVMDSLVVYTHCPAPPDRLEVDLRNIFLLADCEVSNSDGVVFGDGGFVH